MAGQLDTLQKLPPQSVEMEQSVLGAILQDNHALVRVLEILQERDFYQDAHRWIFQTMIDLFQDNVPIDVLTVTERLRKKGRFEAAGGATYLVDLVEMVPTAAHVLHHAQVVREKAILRALIQTATTIVTESYEDAEDVDTLLDRAEQAIFEIGQRKTTAGFVHINSILKGSCRRFEELYELKEVVTGILTGVKDLSSRSR